MALGGGAFLAQNKILPGAYINVVSAANASASLSERGIATMPLILDWGVQGAVMEVTSGDFQKNSLKLFGYEYTAPEMKGLRDLFSNIRMAYLFRLGVGGAKAVNAYAAAMYEGARGNELKVAIARNVDDEAKFDVSLYFGAARVDRQTVSSAADLVDNGFVTWNKNAELTEATETAGTPLTGGVSPTPTKGDYQAYLDVIERYSFNGLGCPSNDPDIKSLFAAFTKRIRDEEGMKFQCVAYANPADHEGVVNVLNRATDEGAYVWSAVYWVTGVIAGTAVNRSALNKVYDGEFTLDVNYTQAQLENAINAGEFAFHQVGSDIRVLSDINSLVSVSPEKGEDFKQNQVIRVIDQIANDIAVLFNTKYMGIIPNDASGRISLWNDIVKHHQQLQSLRAIEDFRSEDITVEQGDTKRSVVVNDVITAVNAMAQLYMTCVVA